MRRFLIVSLLAAASAQLGCNGSSGSPEACSTSAECDADPTTFGRICIQGTCEACFGDNECQRVEYYGASAVCVDGRCRESDGNGGPGGNGGADCEQTVCAERQLCDVVNGTATCLEACEGDFEWNAATGSCDPATQGCESVVCADRQLCGFQNGTPQCLPECETGFDWDGSMCVVLANANCQASDPDSILDDCTDQNRACVEADEGASCGDCLAGFLEDGASCRLPLDCEAADCNPSTELCVVDEGEDARCVAFDPATCEVEIDACPPNTALDPETRQCETCQKSCSGEGFTGDYFPIRAQTDECLCETVDGYFISKSNRAEAVRCDLDEDGWVKITAKNSIEDLDCAIRSTARCDVRTVDTLVLYSDEDAEPAEVSVSSYAFSSFFSNTEFLSLYESDANDDLSLRSESGAFDPLENFYSGAGSLSSGPLEAKNLNSLTKACAANASGTDSVDYNANGISDVNEWHGMSPSGVENIDESVRDFIHLSYFIELMEGWYVQPTPPLVHGEYHLREKSRRGPPRSTRLLSIEPQYDNDFDDYGGQCFRKEDTRFAELPNASGPNIGMDYSRPFSVFDPSAAPNGFFMGHSSQFKCVNIFAETDSRDVDEQRQAPQDVALSTVTGPDAPLELAPCRRDPGANSVDIDRDASEANPTDPPILCAPGGAAVGVVAFATVVYDPSAPSGCINECDSPELLPPGLRCPEPNTDCEEVEETGQIDTCGLEVGCAFCTAEPGGSYSCVGDDGECSAPSGGCGECIVDDSVAVPTATCVAQQNDCGGNCSTCAEDGATGLFQCQASVAACAGDCAACSGSGNTFNCVGQESACDRGECDVCITVNATTFSCQDQDSICDVDDGFVGSCSYASLCSEQGQRSFVDFSCNSGTCVSNSSDIIDPTCNRDQTNVDCGSTTCDPPSCGYSSTCAESAPNATVSCSTPVCSAGACGGTRASTESRSCNRDTDGDFCGARQCGGTSAEPLFQSLCCASGGCDDPCGACE